jgi:uncharacterized protein (TIGR03067 family)
MLLLTLAMAIAAPMPKESKEPTIVGEWTVETMAMGGKSEPAKFPFKLVFAKDGTFVMDKGPKGPRDVSKYTHDPKKAPAELDVHPPKEFADAGKMLGIYKIEGDSLTIALGVLDERPTKFESPPKSLVTVFVCKRVKKD